MFKNIKRLAQTSKDMLLTLTLENIEVERKQEKDQTLVFSYIRGDLVDYSHEYPIDSKTIEVGETFQKKTTLWFSSGKVQEKKISIAIRVRDGPSQPSVHGGGFRDIATEKIDIGQYGSSQNINNTHALKLKLSKLQDSNFKSVTVNLSFRFGVYNASDANQRKIAE